MSAQSFKKFVSEEEVVEERQRRQAEWERVRKEDDPEECPEEETRSLFEQLEANKSTKDREYEDESKLRSSVKGLDNEEVQFLNYVSNRQMQLEKERNNEEKMMMKELEHAAKVIKMADKAREQKSSTEKPASSSSSSTASSTNTTSSSGKKSQMQLLSGAIKRKSVDKGDSEQTQAAKVPKITESTDTDKTTRPDSKLMTNISKGTGVAVVAGVLPGISRYGMDDSSTENSSNSSDSEADHAVMPSAVTQRVIQEMMKKIKSDCG